MDKNFLVYMHTSPSGKSYVGQTRNYKSRNSQHQTRGCCRAFNAAVKKYGWDNFTHTILADGLSIDESNELESFFIDWLDTLAPNGYNLKTGGSNSRPSEDTLMRMSAASKGKTASKETREKLSRMRIGNQNAKGRVQTREEKVMRSASNIGKHNISNETREKLSKAMTGNKNASGRVQTDEEKIKRSLIMIAHYDLKGRVTTAQKIGRANTIETKELKSIGMKASWEKRRAALMLSSDTTATITPLRM